MKTLRLLSLLVLAARAVAGENLLRNGDFSDGITPWVLKLGGEAKATAVVSEGALSVLVLQGGSSRWTVGLEQALGAACLRGATYVVSFDIRSDVPRAIDVVLKVPGGKILGSSYGIPTGPQLRRESFTYVHESADAVLRLAFRLGGDPATAVSIDNVVVELSPAPPTPNP